MWMEVWMDRMDRIGSGSIRRTLRRGSLPVLAISVSHAYLVGNVAPGRNLCVDGLGGREMDWIGWMALQWMG